MFRNTYPHKIGLIFYSSGSFRELHSEFFKLGGVVDVNNDRYATQTDGYLLSNDQRRRKNSAADNSFVYGDDETPADPVGGFGSIFRTAIAASGSAPFPGMATSCLILTSLTTLLASGRLGPRT